MIYLLWQSLGEAAPRLVVSVPAGHGEHVSDPLELEKLPFGQVTQRSSPSEEYVPGLH